MLEKKRIAFTHSRLRRCSDTALAEARNGRGVRRQFGYAILRRPAAPPGCPALSAFRNGQETTSQQRYWKRD
ncbi:hypothetical protein [Burkholderia sp. S-53]|uniref:hypothetical protein n=1 Tax=Burkholderia sp. S-53 TaxID=2906514 RepID=UPI0021D2C54A|nr:hypothetical protein [Burkholderia sp. S-53]UXU91940.1 hypothetical protein LXM88_27695 [Burkholderia sp. S-53]